VQIALALTLLVVAGLFVVSLANVGRVDLGLNPSSVVTFNVSPRLNRYSPERIELLYSRIREALEAEPDILGASAADVPVLANASLNLGVTLFGVEVPEEVDNGVLVNAIRPGLLSVLEVPLLSGRDFTDGDTLDSPPVAIVNEAFLRRFDLGSAQSAVGRYVRFTFWDAPIEIVGVVADAKYRDVKGPIEPQFYAASTWFADAQFSTAGQFFYVRTNGPTDSAFRTITRVIADIDPTLPVSNLRSMEEQIRENVYSDRLVAMLTAAVAGLATLLAAFGLYAVLAFNIAQRTGELGLRIALGARARDLRRLVVRPVCRLAIIGIAIGALGAVVAGRVVESLLFLRPIVLLGAPRGSLRWKPCAINSSPNAESRCSRRAGERRGLDSKASAQNTERVLDDLTRTLAGIEDIEAVAARRVRQQVDGCTGRVRGCDEAVDARVDLREHVAPRAREKDRRSVRSIAP
jgi:ABC-type antimicrobial peptide transport system permease subunit